MNTEKDVPGPHAANPDSLNSTATATLANLLTGHQYLLTALVTYLIEGGKIDREEFLSVLEGTKTIVAKEAEDSGMDPRATTLAIRQMIGMLKRNI